MILREDGNSNIQCADFLKQIPAQLQQKGASFYYFNDEIPTEADFEKAIGDYLSFEFAMVMQNRE